LVDACHSSRRSARIVDLVYRSHSPSCKLATATANLP
jgi:hypothetical protein